MTPRIEGVLNEPSVSGSIVMRRRGVGASLQRSGDRLERRSLGAGGAIDPTYGRDEHAVRLVNARRLGHRVSDTEALITSTQRCVQTASASAPVAASSPPLEPASG